VTNLGLPEILIILVVVVLVFGRKRWFGGGRGGFHPIPANDSWLLTRKRGKKQA